MLKKIFLLAVFLAAPLSLLAQGPLPDGNYRLAMISSPGVESNMVLIKIETKDGKQTGSLLSTPPRSNVTVKSFTSNAKEVVIALSSGLTFTSASAGPEKCLLGNLANENLVYRAKLAPTSDEKLDQSNQMVRVKIPEAYTRAISMLSRPAVLSMQARNEKDTEKKKSLQDQARAAQKEADDKATGLFLDFVKNSPESPVALDASQTILGAAKSNVDEATALNLVKIIETHAKPYGAAYVRHTKMQAINSLLRHKGLEAVALKVIEPLYKALTDNTPPAVQQPLLSSYVQALKASKKMDEAKTVEARLEKVEGILDREYMAKVPPFKPAKFSGRKDAEANRVVVMELFTGAQCPPCVAADVAFDALEKSYAHKDLVLIQYHMHIPGPDPLTNPDTVARWNYYSKAFPGKITGTPSTLFNGKPEAGGGGLMANAEQKYQQYAKIIDPILEKSTPVKVGGSASRQGDKIDINVDVYGAESGDPLKLRLLVVEESIKYVGSNKLRFHHQVVRAMPGGVDGIEIKDKNFKHQTSADISKIRAELNNYLDEFAKSRPFPYPQRPLDMKNLKVIAIVQNDKTAEILQACQLDVDSKVAAK